MYEKQKASTTARMQFGDPPTDEAVDRLTQKIAEIHERLGAGHQARAAFERAGDRGGREATDGNLGSWYRPGDPMIPFGPPLRPDGFAVGLCDFYSERGRARIAREEYHLAVADFGAALAFHPAASQPDFCADLWDGRQQAYAQLRGSFPSPGDKHGDSSGVGTPAPAWMTRVLPKGYLVVGDDAILMSYPLTPEGRTAAIDQAECLAGDGRFRNFLVERYLVDYEDFEVFVYSFDGFRLVLEHLALVVGDDDADPEVATIIEQPS